MWSEAGLAGSLKTIMCEGALTPRRGEEGTLWMYGTAGGLRCSLISESEEAYPQRKKCSVPARHKKSEA